ncbi:MAG: hypothetical protein B6244_08530 [Candidatus Cloacimonetes bacterium 4572_55]|nr:MAG: hypothetical protein B6244_08530 [Candidatus Cloacimonetes bacterium 4572_55]
MTYQIISKLGSGSFGTVYKIQYKNANLLAALKRIHSDNTPSDRFKRIFNAMRHIESLHCARMIEWAGTHDDTAWIMELVEGEPISCLKPRDESHRGDNLSGIVNAIIQVCNGLDELHSKNIVYRDLNPGNIMVQPDSTVKLIDFDLARIDNDVREEGRFIGTPEYASPEHFDRRPSTLDQRSDLYSLGALAYELITGQLPFQARNMEQLEREHRYDPPRRIDLAMPPGISEELQTAILTLLAKKPEDRYQNAASLAYALQETPEGQHTSTKITAKGVYLLPSRFVNRAQPLRFLRRQFQYKALQPQGQTVFISGESGIGKTRLYSHFQRELASRRIPIFHAKAEELNHGSDRVLGDIVIKLVDSIETRPDDEKREMIGRFGWDLVQLAPDLIQRSWVKQLEKPPDLIDARAVESRLFDALITFIENIARTSFLICLDDVQWAGKRVARFLFYAARNIKLRSIPVFLLALYRQDEVKLPTVIFLENELQKKKELPRLIIDSLQPEDIFEMLASMLGLTKTDVRQAEDFVQPIMQITTGNPLFVRELLCYLTQTERLSKRDGHWMLNKIDPTELPIAIKKIIDRRFRNLPDTTQQVLLCASVIGRIFDLDILQTATGLAESELRYVLEFARVAHWIEGIGNDQYQFVYDSEHKTLDHAIADDQRKNWSRLIGDALERKYADNKDAVIDELARHSYHASHDLEKAIGYCGRAGDLAGKKYENDKAILFYDWTIEMLRKAGHTEGEVDYLLKKSVLAVLIGEWDKALKLREKALNLAKKTNNYQLLGRAHHTYGNILWRKSMFDEAMSHFDESLSIHKNLNDEHGIAATISNKGLIYSYRAEYDKALECYGYAYNSAHKLNDKLSIGICAGNLGNVHSRKSNYQKALSYYEELLKIGEELDDKRNVGYALSCIGIVHFKQCHYDAAIECYERALTIAHETGNQILFSSITGSLGEALYFKGDYDAAIACYERALKIGEKMGDNHEIILTTGRIGILLADKGEFDAALAYYKRSLKLSQTLRDNRSVSTIYANMGVMYYSKGDIDKAISCFDNSISICKEIQYVYGLCAALTDKAEARFFLKNYDSSKQLNEEGREIARRINRSDMVFKADMLAAKIDYATGKPEKAIQILTGMLAQTQDKYEFVTLHNELWQMYKQRDQTGQAQEHRRKALELYRKLYEKTPKYEYKQRIEELQA